MRKLKIFLLKLDLAHVMLLSRPSFQGKETGVFVTIVVADDDLEYRLLVSFLFASLSETMRMSL